MERIPIEFNVQVFGKLIPYSQTISRARVRIFYKFDNRNGTYITEEFSKKLLSTISYTPIKGIYEEEDFSDHGKSRVEGRIYGVVPEQANIAWEDHLDEDGVKRTYACADALLFTALYPETSEIIGKGQSMELYAPSIKGAWEMKEGKKMFVYTDGCFLGLQVLGDTIEPCFEGSEFFSLYANLKKIVDEIKGGKRMVKFKLSDSAKHDKLFTQVNPNFNEVGGWEVDYAICDIYDDYMIVYGYNEGQFGRWYYQKDNSNDTVALGEVVKVFIVDVTEDENKALNLLKTANNGTFEKVDEVFTTVSEKIKTLEVDLQTKTEEYSLKEEELTSKLQEIEVKDGEISTLSSNYTTLEQEVGTIKQEKEALSTEIDQLKEFKKQIEMQQKEEVFAKYSTILTEEAIKPFKEKIEEYTIEDLRKELAYLAVEKNPNVFGKNDEPRIPLVNVENLTGAAKIISKYKNKNK